VTRFANLPAPVARYLRFALAGATPIDEVRLTQRGTLRTDLASASWLPFDAEQVVCPTAARFEWHAQVRIAPLLHVSVRDTLGDGKGFGEVKLLSFTVSAAGTRRRSIPVRCTGIWRKRSGIR
jgi:hypothetical protein